MNIINDKAMKSWNSFGNVMLDIEAIGEGFGGVVTSIGALQFCPITGATGKEFKVNIAVQSAINKGMHVSQGPLEFWFDQPKEAQQAMFQDAIPIEEALSKMNSWITKLNDPQDEDKYFDRRDVYWWANGGNYDFTMVDGCYNACKSSFRPWSRRNIMDWRTIKHLLGYRADDSIYEDNLHDALSDCYRQVKMVKETMDIILGVTRSTTPST